VDLNIGWLDSTATYMSDPLHPNLSGYEKMAAYDVNATASPAPSYGLGGIFLIFLMSRLR